MTKKTVSLSAKRNFLLWFAETHVFDLPSSKQILFKIIDHEELLTKIHLIFNGPYPLPLLVVSASNTGMPSLLLKTVEKTYRDFQQIWEYINKIDSDELIYLTLYFCERNNCELYQTVSEDKKLILEPNTVKENVIDFELSLWNEAFRQQDQKSEIMQQIDYALDTGNKKKFRHLVKKLKKF